MIYLSHVPISKEMQIRYFRILFTVLPEGNKGSANSLLATLRAILHHSQNVIANESYNKMGKTNMATVIGPNLLRPEVQSDMSVIKGTADINNITYCFFDSYNDIFLSTETTFGVIGIVRILYDYSPQGEHEIACTKGDLC